MKVPTYNNFFIAAAILSIAATSTLSAGEGMWQPHQLPALTDKLQSMGLELDPKEMTDLTAHPMGAVINLNGCTASFVSPRGLVVTNHHCAYGTIQYNSTEDDNILENGFVSQSDAAEKPAAPGTRVYVTESIADVTNDILKGTAALSNDFEFNKKIEDTKKAIIRACEADDSYRCRVASFHGGVSYHLFKQLAIRDVRLAYNPSLSVGKYGGDIDNWMWPRHTGDFAFFRAYVGPDGKPADYSKDNVPFEPEHFLKVNDKGVLPGDFVMIIGYPGYTDRHRVVREVSNTFGWLYPTSRQYREDLIRIIKESSEPGSDARIKYESQIAQLANYAKNFQSMVESYQKTDFKDKKVADEQAFARWLKKTDRLDLKTNLDEALESAHKTLPLRLVRSYLGQTAMLPAAQRLYRLSHERVKADANRESGYQDRDMTFFKQNMQRISKRYVPAIDQKILAYVLKQYAKLPAAERLPALDDFFAIQRGEQAVEKKLAAMYQSTKLGDEAIRLAWMEKSKSDFESSEDPFIQLAVAMLDTELKLEQSAKARNGRLTRARSAYMAARLQYEAEIGRTTYADANFTLRLSAGAVKGYSPQDGLVATPFTTLQGLAAKATGKKPFHASKKHLQLIQDKQYGKYALPMINSVPVNFLATLDITGGNSGSPVLNGKGELVGLAFDGVYESIIGDWAYDNDKNRSIQVDSRYLLWVMTQLDGADRLVKEMQIVR